MLPYQFSLVLWLLLQPCFSMFGSLGDAEVAVQVIINIFLSDCSSSAVLMVNNLLYHVSFNFTFVVIWTSSSFLSRGVELQISWQGPLRSDCTSSCLLTPTLPLQFDIQKILIFFAAATPPTNIHLHSLQNEACKLSPTCAYLLTMLTNC